MAFSNEEVRNDDNRIMTNDFVVKSRQTKTCANRILADISIHPRLARLDIETPSFQV